MTTAEEADYLERSRVEAQAALDAAIARETLVMRMTRDRMNYYGHTDDEIDVLKTFNQYKVHRKLGCILFTPRPKEYKWQCVTENGNGESRHPVYDIYLETAELVEWVLDWQDAQATVSPRTI